MGREVSLLSPEAAVAGLCSDGQCVLGLFADQTSVGSTVGGLGSRVRPGRERPEEAAGSQAFGYFCQIFGKSRQLWQLSDGGLVVEFVFLLTWIRVPLCPPYPWEHCQALQHFLGQNSQQTPKSSPWLFVAVTRVSGSINTPWIVGAHHLDPSMLE